MEETLIQRHRVGDEGFRVVNPFFWEKNKVVRKWSTDDGTPGISIGKLRASSRGKTEDASVIRNYWA